MEEIEVIGQVAEVYLKPLYSVIWVAVVTLEVLLLVGLVAVLEVALEVASEEVALVEAADSLVVELEEAGSVQCSVFSVQCSVFSVQCSVFSKNLFRLKIFP